MSRASRGLPRFSSQRAGDTSCAHRNRARTCVSSSRGNYKGSATMTLLFLYYLCLFSEEAHLSFLFHLFGLLESAQTALVTPENAFNNTDGVLNLIVSPSDFKHPPVTVNDEGCHPFLLSVLFSLTIGVLVNVGKSGLTSTESSSFLPSQYAVTLSCVRIGPYFQNYLYNYNSHGRRTKGFPYRGA